MNKSPMKLNFNNVFSPLYRIGCKIKTRYKFINGNSIIKYIEAHYVVKKSHNEMNHKCKK